MSDTKNSNTNKLQQISDKVTQEAVPYIPPPTPQEPKPFFNRNPIVNTLGIAVLIIIGGFMTYNYVGQRLTMTAHESIGPATYQNEGITPTNTPTPSL